MARRGTSLRKPNPLHITIKLNYNYSFSSYRAVNILYLDICTLLGCDAAFSGKSLPTFGDNLSVPFARVNKSRKLKMGLMGCPETSVFTTIRRVTTQKSADLIYFVAEA
jgi:4-alpha-glucanotransferase